MGSVSMGNSSQKSQNFILLSCSQDAGLGFLESSLLAGILKDGNSFVIPCLGLDTQKLDKFRYLESEILLLKMQHRDTELDQDLLQDLLTSLNGGILGLKLEGHSITPARLSCSNPKVWQTGLKIVSKIRES